MPSRTRALEAGPPDRTQGRFESTAPAGLVRMDGELPALRRSEPRIVCRAGARDGRARVVQDALERLPFRERSVLTSAGILRGPAVSDPDKRAAKEARRVAKAAAKEEQRRLRRETASAKQEKDRERRERNLRAAGVEVMDRQFGLKRIVLYENGYVQIFSTATILAALVIDTVAKFDAVDRWMKRTSRVPFEKLRSIDAPFEKLRSIDVSTQIQDESEGDRVILLTIVTNKRVHTLKATGDASGDVDQSASELETAAKALLDEQRLGVPPPVTVVESPPRSALTAELTKLAELHQAGNLSADEFAVAKARLLES